MLKCTLFVALVSIFKNFGFTLMRKQIIEKKERKKLSKRVWKVFFILEKKESYTKIKLKRIE